MFGAKPPAPPGGQVEENKSADPKIAEASKDIEEAKSAFLKQPFDYVSQKWIATVKTNEEQFAGAV